MKMICFRYLMHHFLRCLLLQLARLLSSEKSGLWRCYNGLRDLTAAADGCGSGCSAVHHACSTGARGSDGWIPTGCAWRIPPGNASSANAASSLRDGLSGAWSGWRPTAVPEQMSTLTLTLNFGLEQCESWEEKYRCCFILL